MTSIGTTLKEARNKQSLTLDEVHAKIKIHPRVLQLLEEEKFDKLPSPLFVKSFLRNYADFLNVNADEIVRAYEKVERKEPDQVLFIRPAEERLAAESGFDFSSLVGPAAAVIGIVLLAVVVYFAAGALRGRPAHKKEKAAPVHSSQAVVSKSAPSLQPRENGSARWLRSTDQGNFPAIPRDTPLELKIKAVDNVWIRVTSDGKVVFQSILKRGASSQWSAKETLEIWSGNSSNMMLILNGYTIGSPGRGVVKRLSINHHGMKIAS